jgi:hypothetical protein
MSFQVVHLAELESIPVGDRGLRWHPIRSTLDIRSFGVNAYSAEPGEEIVEDHTEEALGHEEIYVVVSGRAVFTLGDEEVDAPAGTIVHLGDPSLRRTAVAVDPGTVVLAVGGKPGAAFEPSAWELAFRTAGLEPEAALALYEEGVPSYPETSALQYNLACLRLRTGRRDEGLAALRRAAELDPGKVRAWAAGDADLDSVRAEVEEILA